MAAEKTLLTGDDLLGLPAADGTRYELVRGELRTMPPVNYEHGIITSRLDRRMASHVEANGLGEVLAGDPGFTLEPDPQSIRAPDVAFFAADRVPRERPSAAFPDLIPDLVAEIVSPSETAFEVEEKIQEWLNAGVRVVLALYPRSRTITIRRPHGESRVLTENEALECPDLLPGFSCRVGDLFPY